MSTPPPDPLTFPPGCRAYQLDGRGGARRLAWNELSDWRPEHGTLWTHLDAMHDAVRAWLEQSSGLDEQTCEDLLADETRPRCHVTSRGLLMLLRGVNLNEGAEPEDMVSLRLFVDGERMISLFRRRVMAAGDVAAELEREDGAHDSGDLFVSITGHLLDRMEPVLEQLDDSLDDLEESAGGDDVVALQAQLAELRRRAVALRRYLAPMREALARAAQVDAPFFGPRTRGDLHALVEQLTRYVEDLDEVRERATVSYEFLASRQSEELNRRMFVLSLVAAVFLPLSLVTGLLGINVSGIPMADGPYAFWAVCVMLVGFAGLEIWILRRLRWW
ncbi:MAG: zinc transporter ZntB [Planctomycetes bacterium]|nr:zinc transporter ZntB [Planctomycetota bacterium]